MHVILWDTRKRGVTKDFGGGFGMGQYHGQGGLRGKLIRHFYVRDRRPVALNFAYLAGVFRQLGHSVQYSEDEVPAGGDVYVFNPSLITLDLERDAMRQARALSPKARILITGVVGYAMPEQFADLDVTIVRGEGEQLLWKLDEVLASDAPSVDVGSVADLDTLPFPDWTPFDPKRFRISYDFTRFPTALIQQSRGCTFTCNYCPYILVENRTRFRAPELIVEEMKYGMRKHGFRSFKFRDPLFGLNRRRVMELAALMGSLPRKIQFSIESRTDLLRRETLEALREVGLNSITVGIETPDDHMLRHYKRKPVNDDRQQQFIATCRELGIRTAAGFMIGFPSDTVESIRNVLRYAKQLNPTFANFNIVTPYPGTEFYVESKAHLSDVDFTKYDMYTPVMEYDYLTREEVLALHTKCFTSFYFRWPYLFDNAHLLSPLLRRLGVGRRFKASRVDGRPPQAKPQAPTAAPCESLPIVPIDVHYSRTDEPSSQQNLSKRADDSSAGQRRTVA